MRAGTLAAFAALLLAAGCLGLTGEGPEQATEPASQPAEPSSSDTDPAASTGTDAREEPGPLERPPSWIPGEHWTVEVTSTLTGEPITWKRVVAGYTAEGYLVGQPVQQARPAPLLLHIPGMGEISQTNLSYNVHEASFQPLDFPLTEGKSWQTSFEGDPVNATVEATEDGQATVTFCCQRNLTLVYDAELRAIREMTVDDGFLAYEVTDHGFAHRGPVEIPLDREIVFFQGRIAGGLGAQGGAGPPTGQADVEDAGRVAFTQIVGNLDASPAPETGVYREQAHLPNGSIVTTQQAASTEGLQITFHEATNASGTWRFDHVAAGPGIALTEGIGYQPFREVLD